MIIRYENSDYPFDFEDVTIKQALMIEKHTGTSFADWGKSIAAGGSLTALQALGWLITDGGDLDKPIADCDVKFVRLGNALSDALAAEQAAAEPAEDDSPRPTSGTSSAPTEISRAGQPLPSSPEAT